MIWDAGKDENESWSREPQGREYSEGGDGWRSRGVGVAEERGSDTGRRWKSSKGIGRGGPYGVRGRVGGGRVRKGLVRVDPTE